MHGFGVVPVFTEWIYERFRVTERVPGHKFRLQAKKISRYDFKHTDLT